MALLVANIVWTADGDVPLGALAERLGLPVDGLGAVELIKRSVDGRRRPPVWLANYRVELDAADEAAVLARKPHGVRAWTEQDDARFAEVRPDHPVARQWPRAVRPIVIGAGPAGLFAATARGGGRLPSSWSGAGRWNSVTTRSVASGGTAAGRGDQRGLWGGRHGRLLGWQDLHAPPGRRAGYIFRSLVEFGADPEILEEGWAHLGTDRIRALLPRLRQRLIDQGVEVRFNTSVAGFVVEDGRCVGVTLADGSVLRGGPVIVATGHSARDTWRRSSTRARPPSAAPSMWAGGAPPAPHRRRPLRRRPGRAAAGELPAPLQPARPRKGRPALRAATPSACAPEAPSSRPPTIRAGWSSTA